MTANSVHASKPGLFDISTDNWRLALLVGLIISIAVIWALPSHIAFWIVGIMVAALTASIVTNAYRRRHFGGLLVAPAIAVLFVMNIFPLLWSLGLSFYAYQSNQQSIRFVGLANYIKVLTNDIAAPANWAANRSWPA